MALAATASPAVQSEQEALYEIAERSLPGAGLGGYSLPTDLRFVVARAEGAGLISAEGRRYIDFVGGAGANILGANHPAVVAAVQAQAAKAIHVFGTLNDAAVRLSEKLVQSIPCAEKVIFTTTGSEATAYALRMARAFTGRDKVLKFEGAYHGNHDYAAFSQFPTAAATIRRPRPTAAACRALCKTPCWSPPTITWRPSSASSPPRRRIWPPSSSSRCSG